MIRALLLICISWVLLGSLKAQVLTVEPSNSSATVNANESTVIAKSTIKNISSDTKEFRWVRTIVSITEGWETAVCDKNLCYAPKVDSMTLTLAAGEESNLDIYIYPNGVVGKAIVEIEMKEVGVDTTLLRSTYAFNQTTSVKLTEYREIALFPNPTTTHFEISTNESIAKIELYNLVGDRIRTYYAYRDKRYSVADLGSGLYLVRLLDVNNRIIKTLRLNKR